MSTENTSVSGDQPEIVDNVGTDLDTFSAEFFGQNKADLDKTKSGEVSEEDEPADAQTEEDTHPEDDDTLDTDDDQSEEDEEEEDPAPKPKKKNRFQERIDEVIGKQRETERKLEEALAELNRLKTPEQKAPTSAQPATDRGPSPTDTNEDGTDKYPLGEFDPKYITDLTKFAYNQERIRDEAERAAKAEQIANEAIAEKARAELQQSWNAKLEPAQERYPDFREKGEELLSGFSDLDPAYGEYLTSTLMSMDKGTDVLYYLASNPEEARKIVNSGPQKASIALGRLEARFLDEDSNQQQKVTPKISKAPAPPPTNKGRAAANPAVRPDTDDLDAFSNMFFKKR